MSTTPEGRMLVAATLRAAALTQPYEWQGPAEACEDKEEAYLLAWAHFQAALLALAREREEPSP